MKRILVTGATGFIGNSLIEKLLDCGYDVIPIGRTLKSWSSDFLQKNLVKIDLATEELPDLGKIDCACLLASRQPYKKNEWNKYYEINSKQIGHFLNKKIDQLIYVSTTSVNSIYGLTDPKSYYGLSKSLGERLLKINKNNFSQSTVLRFPSVMGVNHHGGIINDFREWIENNESIVLYDRGKKYRNLLHVDEAISAILCTIKSREKLSSYEEYEIGSENSMTVEEIAKYLCALLGKYPEIKLLPKVTNSENVFVNNSKAISKIDYMPKNIRDAIKKYLRDCNYEV